MLHGPGLVLLVILIALSAVVPLTGEVKSLQRCREIAALVSPLSKANPSKIAALAFLALRHDPCSWQALEEEIVATAAKVRGNLF